MLDERSERAQLMCAIFDSVATAILVSDDSGRFVDANPAATLLFGITHAELLACSFSTFARLDREGLTEFTLRDGTCRTVEVSSTANVMPGKHLSVLRDVSARVAAEDALRRNEAMFRAVIEKSAEIISLTTRDGTTRYLTPAAWRLLGYSEPNARSLRDHVIPEDQVRIADELARLVETGARDMAMEIRVVHRDGSIRWIETTGTNLLDDPDVAAIVGNYRDITARKRVEAELLANRDALEEAQSIAQLGSWWAGVASDQIGWSNECYRIFGLPVGGPMTKDVLFSCIHPADLTRVRGALPEMLAGRDLLELDYRVLWPDGRIRWVHARMVADRRGTGAPTIVRGTIQDVTERHDAVAALFESEQRYRRIIENTSDGIWMYDANDVTTFLNPRMAAMLGCTAADGVGKSVFAYIDPSRRAAGEQRLASRRLGVADRSDFTLRRIDGIEVQTSIQANPLFDSEGRFEGVVALVSDVTAERDADAKRHKAEAELHQAENQLRQGQKMEAVGRLAGGVAHDFNNLLSVILSYAELALGDLPPDDRLRDDLEQIVQAGKQAAGLTRQLLAFSRQQVLQPRVVELQKIIAPLELMLRRMLSEDVALTVLVAHSRGQVLVDPGQIEQVVMNLTVNARDAMPDGGEITIEITDIQLATELGTARAIIPPGDYVMLSVTDTGSGMDAATSTRIFEPFFTTKPLGKGTGLGLSTVFGIVQQSSGYVDVTSELGKGTVFSIYIPRTDQAPVTAFADVAATVLRGTETVLLVEDEAQVRTVACAILRRNGYTVLESSNAGEAFLISKSYDHAIDVLLTDIVMPRMSGRKLAEELAATRPAMKVIYVSGYTDAIIQPGILDATTWFLQKPFTPDLLLRKIREVLALTTGGLARQDNADHRG